VSDRTDGRDRKQVVEMVGEFCREAGLLVLVFGYLDTMLGHNRDGASVWQLALGLSAMGITLVVVGISIERMRTIR
jgi:hypothetical protein